MVLMQARLDPAIPHRASAQFVKIAALSQKQISVPEGVALDVGARYTHHLQA